MVTAVTFVDKKFMPLAVQQHENFLDFGVKHEINEISNQTYGIYLWMDLIDATIEAIHRHGRIFRVDSEIRMLKLMPKSWHEQENVLFFIEPVVRYPWYIAINTGHMILGESAIPFLTTLKEMTLALIPPNYDGSKLVFDDEDLTAPAIRISNLQYRKEVIDYVRSDESTASSTRGYWHTPHTVFTHPFIHNWGVSVTTYPQHSLRTFLRNHFSPGSPTKLVDAVLLGLENRSTSPGYWKSMGFIQDGIYWYKDGWEFNPSKGEFRPVGETHFKAIDKVNQATKFQQ